MRSLLTVSALTILASTSFAQDDKKIEVIETKCNAIAEAEYKKASKDAVALPGAFGGNISHGYVESIKKAKAGFVMLKSASCQADEIRKQGIKTPFPLD